MEPANQIGHTEGDRGYGLLRHGTSIFNYSNNEYLEEDLEWFKKNNFRIIEFNLNKDILSGEEFLKELQEIPDIGMHSLNLDSFNDGLSEIEIAGAGLIIVFRHSEILLSFSQNIFLYVLDSLDGYSRFELLNGKRVITLVQTDDPHSEVGRLGERYAHWNPHEWGFKNRKVIEEKIRRHNAPQKD